MDIDPTSVYFVLAWFIQMGIHEGAHAYAAHACGDDTAYLMGKRSFDPFRHIAWTDLNSVLLGVILPVYTALSGYIPMGMAWVPVNPLRFKRMRRDHALVSAAGPLANLALAAALLGLHYAAVLVSDSRAIENLDQFLHAVYITSIVYGIFNLIPIPPLDGSKVLYYFLGPSARQVMEDIEPYGFWLLILLFAFGRGGVILTPFIAISLALW